MALTLTTDEPSWDSAIEAAVSCYHDYSIGGAGPFWRIVSTGCARGTAGSRRQC